MWFCSTICVQNVTVKRDTLEILGRTTELLDLSPVTLVFFVLLTYIMCILAFIFPFLNFLWLVLFFLFSFFPSFLFFSLVYCSFLAIRYFSFFFISLFYVFLCCLLTLSLVFLVYSFFLCPFLAYDISASLFEAERFFSPVQRFLFEIFT